VHRGAPPVELRAAGRAPVELGEPVMSVALSIALFIVIVAWLLVPRR